MSTDASSAAVAPERPPPGRAATARCRSPGAVRSVRGSASGRRGRARRSPRRRRAAGRARRAPGRGRGTRRRGHPATRGARAPRGRPAWSSRRERGERRDRADRRAKAISREPPPSREVVMRRRGLRGGRGGRRPSARAGPVTVRPGREVGLALRTRAPGGRAAPAVRPAPAEAGATMRRARRDRHCRVERGAGGTVAIHSPSRSFSCSRSRMSSSAYSNSGDQYSASNGHTSMQMPQYMQSEKSIAKRSSTLRWRARAARRGRGPPPCASRCRCTSRGTRARRACRRAVLLDERDDAARARGQVGRDVGVLPPCATAGSSSSA